MFFAPAMRPRMTRSTSKPSRQVKPNIAPDATQAIVQTIVRAA
jgi:hypothetical protein